MEQQHFNKLVSFIWNIANDVLVNAFEKGEYKNIILPFTVLRRLDVLLEPTKEKVLERKRKLEAQGITVPEVVLFKETGYPFYNTSLFTMRSLKASANEQQLKVNFIDYLNGFSADVQDIIEKFQLRHKVDMLSATDRLGSLLDKMTSSDINLSVLPVKDDEGNIVLPGLDNHTMGTMFEELLRRFNEENNVTEAGEHFTPRDYVALLADLAVLPVADKLSDGSYTIYDGASGTGGILTIAENRIEEIARQRGLQVKTYIRGQELQPDTYATCKADLLISGGLTSLKYNVGGADRQPIVNGSTISQDGHMGEQFDFCISNPPFGTPWKQDLKNRGLGEKEKDKFTDARFYGSAKDGGQMCFLPDISDCQMLFLANNLSRMKDTPLGTRVVEVHNGSSLFTGNAGKGASNLRQYIIENDLLECIIAMPEKDFYNTGIGTYIWVLSNRKETRRKGKVQLIDATGIKTPLRKNLGEKNCETNEADRAAIMKLYFDFKETPESRIFPNEEFGFWEVQINRPARDEKGEIIYEKKKGAAEKTPKIDPKLKDTEVVPFTYPGGVEGFFETEVRRYVPDALLGSTVVGYELSFTKYFYKPVKLRSQEEIKADIIELERLSDGMLNDILA